MTVDAGKMAAEWARVQAARRGLGERLAVHRQAAGVTQPELGRALGRTRSMLSKVEHGTRGMPAPLWQIADDRCAAAGALVAEHTALTQAEQDYRGRCRTRRRHARQAAAQAELAAAGARPVAGPDWAGTGDEQAEELVAVVRRLARSIGRREAIQVAGLTLAAVGLSGLDIDEHTRVAQAVAAPGRVDAQVVENLAATLTQAQRLEDTLGAGEVLDTVVAQHALVRRLLAGGSPSRLKQSLAALDSHMATTIGIYLVDLGQLDLARRYVEHARKSGHDAGHPAYAAYAAANASFVAYWRGDTPTALDTAAAARSLAARTDDTQLKALTELRATDAYALDGQHRPCMAASGRAQQLLARGPAAPASPAYWVHDFWIGSHLSRCMSLLGRPREAVDAATAALARYDRSYRSGRTFCQVRLGHALVLSREIDEASQVLGDTAASANLSPRLTGELHAARALLQPWKATPAVTTLDARLEACGLAPTPPRRAAQPRRIGAPSEQAIHRRGTKSDEEAIGPALPHAISSQFDD